VTEYCVFGLSARWVSVVDRIYSLLESAIEKAWSVNHRMRNAFETLLRMAVVLGLTFAVSPASATEPCKSIHARANLYGGDGRLRLWHIGTHHEYQPDASSWERVVGWLAAGVSRSDRARYASPASMVYLYADFVVCPVEPFRKGAVQTAEIKSATHRRYVRPAD
jgi:hypothetical protein